MRPTKGLLICLIALLGWLPVAGTADADREKAAERAALAWLALVDAGQYRASWQETASLFQAQVSAVDWEKAVSAARKPFGGLISRELVSATYATTLPGAPDGEYVVLQFATRFKNKDKAVETVTPMMDGGQWRVSGYYVR